jgi:hypothetical protein
MTDVVPNAAAAQRRRASSRSARAGDTDGGCDGFAHANLLAPQAIVTQRAK